MSKYAEDEQNKQYLLDNLKYFCGDINSDCYILEDILSQITYKSGTDRYKLCKTSSGNGSVLYGNTWRGFLKYDENGHKVLRKRDPDNPKKYLSKAMTDYPELMNIAKEFRDLYFPEFHFTHLMLNKNFPVDWHRDQANIGETVIVAVGDFTGGATQLMIDNQVVSIDVHNKPFKFDGSKIKHRCEPFEGTRYAVVFFKN